MQRSNWEWMRASEMQPAIVWEASGVKAPDTEVLQSIYKALADETSKQIYGHRLLYSLFGDYGEIRRMVSECLLDGKKLYPSKVCLYGAGGGCMAIIMGDPEGYASTFVIDQYKTGTYYGLPIISLEDFLKLPDHQEYLIIITLGNGDVQREVAKELERYGLKYVLAYERSTLQYFEAGPLGQTDLKNEVFVDAGALDGETAKYFLDHFENGYVYSFEPNPRQFEITRERLRAYPQAELFPYGAYDENKKLRFDPSEELVGSGNISESGDIEIEARRLDDLLVDRRVTFLKLDIEGAELAALRGAERIIREQKPKLAICVYHKPEDIWEIPALILQYQPNYRLYLRHYTIINTETVLYAIP